MKEINFNYYEENASEFFESTVTADMVDLYTSFLSMVSPGGRILDLGCGSGRDSKYFIRQGFQVEAMDGSPALCRLASEFIGQEVFCAQIEEMDYQQEFDGIWACASLIHAEKKEMQGVLEKVKQALKKRGVLYASFQQGQGEGMRGGRFFNFYDEKELRLLFSRIDGLELVQIFRTEDVRRDKSGEFWMNVIAKRLY